MCFDYEQEELPAWIDPNNFDKVLVNLLSNAFKYTPDGGEIKISLREKVNELTVGDLQHFIEIEVIDSGSGIDANKLEKIFERFLSGAFQWFQWKYRFWYRTESVPDDS